MSTQAAPALDGMFLSTTTLKLDAKGRVSIPASFREVLSRDVASGLLCSTAFSGDAIEAGGQGLLREIEDAIAGCPASASAADRDAHAAFIFGQCETLKIDREGRIVLSERLKAHAGITTQATFCGLGHKFRIWEPERFHAHMRRGEAAFRAAPAAASFPLVPREAGSMAGGRE